MKRTLFILPILALITATVALAKDDKLDAPPDGITPTTATVSQILKHYDAAVGQLKAGVDDTHREVWHFSNAGLAGTETLTRKGFDFRSKIVAGPVVDEYGQFLGHRWHKDPNGYVSPMEAPDPTSFEMLIFMRNFGDTEDTKNDVKVIGEVADPHPAYVVQITRPNYKHPEWVFYDKNTGLIDEIVNAIYTTRYTATYSDYRPTKGLTQPWHIHVTDGRAYLDDDFMRQSLTIGEPVDVRDFITPSDTPAFATYNGHVEIPARVISERLYFETGLGQYQPFVAPTAVVRVNINGRGLDFELSTGDSGSYIDWDVAQQLGLSANGHALRMPDGTPIPYDTIVPSMQIGGLTLHNFAMRALRFNYHIGGDTQVVGTLGYDVLKSGVFKIDYDNGKITLDPASAFDSGQPVEGAFSIPLHFDDGYAFLEGLLNFHFSSAILFANNFEISFVFGHFTSRYPESVKDTNGRNHSSAVVPFADSGGYGREAEVWLSTIPDLQFGQAHFISYYMLGTDADEDYGGHQVDAALGADFLKYYDMYVDYPHNRVLLKPNKSFFNAFHM
ncbi:MAG TPA: retropepsin-like aspartic protease [Candidatus Rubrimentiphilum sp.]|nr:retropepsin-like aspartic protease [Candidatus Rubrimentiphilum sp.]